MSIGVQRGSAASRAVFATINALGDAELLPEVADYETLFAPGRAHVRRVPGHNVWLLYRFDANHVFMITARNEPPVPADDQVTTRARVARGEAHVDDGLCGAD